MSRVGSFPGMHALHRAVRAPQNPLDKSTVVSIYPRNVDEHKCTIQPGTFHIPMGSRKSPGILVVGTSSWWKEFDEDQPMLEIPQSSIQVADSIVRDWANGLLCCDMGSAMPGLFYVPGNKTQEEVLVEHEPQLNEAKAKQDNWYAALVKMGDTLWARSNGNPLSISDIMKTAAEELQFTDKPWLRDFATMKLDNCPACGQLRDANYPVCQHCHTIVNKELYATSGFSQVG